MRRFCAVSRRMLLSRVAGVATAVALERLLLSNRSAALAEAGAAAAAGPDAANGAFAEEIAPGVFVHTGRHELFNGNNHGDVSNCGFVIGAERVAVIDTGGSRHVGDRLRAAVRAVTDKPIGFVINTHMHPDHVLGNAAFLADGPELVAHHKMARGLAARAERYLAAARDLMGPEAMAGTEIVLPTRGIEAAEVIDLGGRQLRLEPQPTAHTDNDLVIADEATGTIFLGDLLFAGHVPAIDGSIAGWLAVLDQLTQRSAARVVPGHGPAAVPWPAASTDQRRYLDTVAEGVRGVIKRGGTLREAVASVGLGEAERWELFEHFHARNVTAAFAELEWE